MPKYYFAVTEMAEDENGNLGNVYFEVSFPYDDGNEQIVMDYLVSKMPSLKGKLRPITREEFLENTKKMMKTSEFATDSNVGRKTPENVPDTNVGKINGRTPDEINKWMEYCHSLKPCIDCKYDQRDFPHCVIRLIADAINGYEKLESRLAQVERERDELLKERCSK